MRDMVVVWLLEIVAIGLCVAFWGPVTFLFVLVGFWTAVVCTTLEIQAAAHLRGLATTKHTRSGVHER